MLERSLSAALTLVMVKNETAVGWRGTLPWIAG